MGITHHPSSAYNPSFNSLAERGIRSVKTILKKTPGRLSDIQLDEVIFALNSHVQPNEQESNNDRFLQRSVRSGLPNSVNLELDPEK